MTDTGQKRTCIVCKRTPLRTTELQTCVVCLGRTRTQLIEIGDLYALLPAEIEARAGTARPLDPSGVRSSEDTVPGGDALVLLAGGSTTTTSSRPTPGKPEGDRAHAADNVDTDTPSVLAMLMSWEDDWRAMLDLAPAGWSADSHGSDKDHRFAPQPTISGVIVFLLRGLSYMAQHHHDHASFAADIGQVHGALTNAVKADQPRDPAAVTCPKCGGKLAKKYNEPDPDDIPKPRRTRRLETDDSGKERWIWEPDWDTHRRRLMAWNRRRMRLDQGGRRDDWHCTRRSCGHILTEAEYYIQVRGAMQETALTARDLALLLGVTPARIRQIVAEHKIDRLSTTGKAPLYPVEDVLRHARGRPLAS